MIFDIYRFSEEKKVKLVVMEFTDYAWFGGRKKKEYRKTS
jgi:hypothetical protein